MSVDLDGVNIDSIDFSLIEKEIATGIYYGREISVLDIYKEKEIQTSKGWWDVIQSTFSQIASFFGYFDAERRVKNEIEVRALQNIVAVWGIEKKEDLKHFEKLVKNISISLGMIVVICVVPDMTKFLTIIALGNEVFESIETFVNYMKENDKEINTESMFFMDRKDLERFGLIEE